MGGPASWLATITPTSSRALAMPRSRLWTIIGSSVMVVVSAKVSAVPSRNMATRTAVMFTSPDQITAARMASTSVRSRFTTMSSRRRWRRSASTPA